MRPFALWAALTASACTPLTFSNTAPIDFDRYQSVFVDDAGDGGFSINLGGLSPREYLIAGLREESGFKRVERGPFEVDVTLRVSLTIDVLRTLSSGLDEYTIVARFELFTADGRLVDSGRVEDQSEYLLEAVEDALDEVVHHYLPSYRL